MKTNKICILIPYFNRLPPYFSLWLNSIRKNDFIDFYMVTDLAIQEKNLPHNFIIENHSLKDIKKRASKFLGFRCKLKSAYKLCDYRPVYFGIFPEIVNQYDWWGHCDFDQIFGDLSILKQLTLPTSKFDKLFDAGHLTLYRNVPEVNERFKLIHKLPVYTYKEAYKTNLSCDFDEALGMNGLYILMKWPKYSNVNIIGDLIPYRHYFETYFSLDPQIYSFENGKTYGYYLINGNIVKHEVLYVHLQKRKMDETSQIDNSNFLMVPDKFIPYEPVTKELILKYADVNIIKPEKPIPFSEKLLAHIKKKDLIQAIIRRIEKNFLDKKFSKRIGKKKSPIDYLSVLSPDYFKLTNDEKSLHK